MTDCPCDDPPKRVLRIPAGLPALPRQTQAFPEVRIALLAEVGRHAALDDWQARGERDFGVMLLEMWAYVADVLGFYDERIANESYLRTAVRRPSLRRIVDLLGYVPAPGVAGSATIAAIAEGRVSVAVPQSTAFRSDAFGKEPPQVFEAKIGTSIHALANSWEIGPVAQATLSGADERTELIFETANFGLAKDRLVLVRRLDLDPATDPAVTRVTAVNPFEGKDGKTYLRVFISPPIALPASLAPGSVQVQTPTVTAVVTKNALPDAALGVPTPVISLDGAFVHLDAIYRQLKENDRVIVVTSADDLLQAPLLTGLAEVSSTIASIGVQVPITRIQLAPGIADPLLAAGTFSFHFTFVDAGRLTAVDETEPSAESLTNPAHPDGVLVTGIVERPPSASGGVLEQKFLLRDADTQGALVKGKLTFNPDGTARFRVTQDEPLPATLKTPITIFGNLLEVTRGESVFDEILGNGEPRQLHQAFKLKKKPLTYLFDESVEGTHARTTLQVRVDGVEWHEVRSFFGRGPEDRVYIVRPNDQGDTFVIFGDGVRGARPPSGIKNIRASYRFGSGETAPPAGAIKQLAKAVKGLRRVESPIAAVIGKDPDPPELLRTAAPRSALLSGRAVSTLDFQALASLLTGVLKATAEFLWIPDQQEAGVVVTYIGTADEALVLSAMRAEAEPNLPLVARRAEAWIAVFFAELDVHPDFDPDVVANAAIAALVEPETGPLATRNAPIGQPLFRSVIFDVIHRVPGVVAIKTAYVFAFAPDGTFVFADFKNSKKASVCAGAGAYLEFVDSSSFARVFVVGATATTPAFGVEAIA